MNIRFKNHSEIRELLQEWLKVRKSKRAAMTNRAIELNLNKLEKLAMESRMNLIEYLEEVIARGWASFYKINNYDNPKVSNNYKRTEIVPQWMNNDIKKEEASPEEIAEIDDLLKEFNKQEELPQQDFLERKAALEKRLKEKYKKKNCI